MMRHLSRCEIAMSLDQPLDLLHQYALTRPQAALYAETHHRVYLVACAEGEFILRVQSMTTRPRLEREVRHLTLLAAGSVPVARVIPTREGASIATAGAVIALLMTRLHGERKTLAALDTALATRLGGLLAQLHHHTFSENTITEAEALFSATGFYPLEALRQSLTTQQRAALDRVWDTLAPTLATTGHTLLHGDYVLHNVLVTDEALALVDLEYSRVGDARYDLASFLWQARVRSDWPALQAAFITGYQEAGGASYDELEPWIAARQLASLHWVAHNRTLMPNSDAVIAQRLQELSAFVVDGHLRRQ
ncbi:MAG: phosphotransferase [Anaerolineae bacterium]